MLDMYLQLSGTDWKLVVHIPHVQVVKYVGRHTLCTEEFARNVKSFASDHNNFLAIEELLGHSAG